MLDRSVLEAAATWYVQLSAAAPGQADRSGWQAWLEQDARHAQAWARVEKLQHQLGGLPQEVALPTLAGARARRRSVAKVLGLLLALGATGWGLDAIEPLPARLAALRTGKGERRQVQLADGSQLHLNTHSAVDIHYSASLREVRLHHGEVLIDTARDRSGRPFVVHTPEGSVHALGTRFSVRSEAAQTEVRVLQQAVELRPSANPVGVLRLEAGQQARFDQAHWGKPTPLPAHSDAWLQGRLMVLEWRLADLLVELERYRPGVLRCSEAVADLRVSGGFDLDHTDVILENLALSLPVHVRYLTRYWVSIEAV
ncbi:iron dicitrate transport regulator FecR [Pseudomonas sp. Leaf127]|uniref:FecR domain-containing protein n=1 Tax=Pseudomonas sp. Leaf127 TaxID=1736267 RepID=UPI0007038CD1|nr:FecR domain-containing protein [Pseudomonas sp. Leaf127]KQQ54501.1 iron dicitrate transport regulator FecR [Pseudomonas sp. Leaf127]